MSAKCSSEKIVRDYDKRAAGKTPEIVKIAKHFDRDFFDGDQDSVIVENLLRALDQVGLYIAK